MHFLLIIPATITCLFMALPANPDAKKKNPGLQYSDRLTPAANHIVATR